MPTTFNPNIVTGVVIVAALIFFGAVKEAVSAEVTTKQKLSAFLFMLTSGAVVVWFLYQIVIIISKLK